MRLIPLARRLVALATDRRGATAMEYGLLAALIAVAAIAAIKGLGGETVKLWENVASGVKAAT